VVDGASRTDAGVHARDQLAAVTFTHPIRPEGFVKALNRRLPPTISVRGAAEVPLSFAPRFANQGKTYCYRLYQDTNRRPLIDRYAWRVPWALEQRAMMRAAGDLVGARNFESFAAANGSHKSAVRTLHAIHLSATPGGVLELRFSGAGFLKQMIRNIVGTLVEVGRGRWPPSAVAEILAAQDRRAAGPTAPACGLELERMHLDPVLTTLLGP
ncbi:tRNA pseudouridine synthase A, partial [Myxococcota bacterium]|nr:tRNA pseudouridine synthase A [Myxococcota bacterium]